MEPRTQRLLDQWLGTYRSENTRDAYERDVAVFDRWCVLTGRTALHAQPGDLDAYRDESLASGASAATVSRRLSGIASFFRYAASVEALDANPLENVDRPETAVSTPETLDDEEVRQLLDAAEVLGPKSAALVGLLASDGMKLGEVLAIDMGHLRRNGGAFAIELRRHDERDLLDLAPRTASAIGAYVAGRGSGPLFLGDSPAAARRKRLSRFGADFLVKRAARAAGIDKPISASILRRSYIESAHRAGTPLAEIAQRVGHRDTRHTARLLETGA